MATLQQFSTNHRVESTGQLPRGNRPLLDY